MPWPLVGFDLVLVPLLPVHQATLPTISLAFYAGADTVRSRNAQSLPSVGDAAQLRYGHARIRVHGPVY